MTNFSQRTLELAKIAEEEIKEQFKYIEDVAFKNQYKVLKAFSDNRVSAECLGSSTGYGYNDRGREILDLVYAQVFEAEAAFARHNIVSGTHALTIGLFGLLRPGDELLSVAGKPYDTLDKVIGISKTTGDGSLSDFGVKYRQVDLTKEETIDLEAVKNAINSATKVVYVQKSRGYSSRRTITNAEIGELVKAAKSVKNDVFVFVDNCYGEFCEEHEPCYYGADLCVGSLIKNAGGGIAQSGGYLAGSKKAIELCSYRFTCPGTGLECGATLGQNENMYKGLFFAPHVVSQALKTAVFAAALFEKAGFKPLPHYSETRLDIIQAFDLGSKEAIERFCQGIQAGSPIDSFVTPEFWDMPGYDDQVIMAAGTFVSGASIELSADAPAREPYVVFMQGGLTYESGKIGVMTALERVLA
ncbi:MAG: hypothetical protein E7646_00715 [Ruminococcaceae bacterium]|nr:hypothetical protein [Oscillospiraceae bacterium]